MSADQLQDDAVLSSIDKPIVTHVRVGGLQRTHCSVIEKDLEAIKRCGTLRDVTSSMEQAINRWKSLGLFKDITYHFQPTSDGEKNDVCVQIDVTDTLRPVKSIGVMSTDSAYPEVNVSFDNFLGGRYSLKGSYICPASRLHSINFSLISNVPFFGANAEYSAGHRTEKKYFHLASSERVFDVKACSRNAKGKISSEFTIGAQRRKLVPVRKSEILGEDWLDFRSTHKAYMRHDFTYSNVKYNESQYLFDMYPLPVEGNMLHMDNEAAGLTGGDFCFLKSQIQFSKFWRLSPFFYLNWNSRFGGIRSMSNGGQNGRIPINDRLFLSGSHVRGFKSIGPSTLDRPSSTRFAATGGNALWASSIGVNFPFLGLPQNGFAAMHLFANAGNLRMINSFSQLTDCWKWIRETSCSIGGGIVITRLPLLGVLPSGRFELNASVPIGVTRNGELKFQNGPSELFDRVKFGLVWSSDAGL